MLASHDKAELDTLIQLVQKIPGFVHRQHVRKAGGFLQIRGQCFRRIGGNVPPTSIGDIFNLTLPGEPASGHNAWSM